MDSISAAQLKVFEHNLLNQISTDQSNETANNEKNKENLVAYPDGA
ncbi:MAG TPA: hypothetical protein VLE89_02945 [Chlamydiales bacterium]|nr:hypothetical protein [Chlamydiales bacterium]